MMRFPPLSYDAKAACWAADSCVHAAQALIGEGIVVVGGRVGGAIEDVICVGEGVAVAAEGMVVVG